MRSRASLKNLLDSFELRSSRVAIIGGGSRIGGTLSCPLWQHRVYSPDVFVSRGQNRAPHNAHSLLSGPQFRRGTLSSSRASLKCGLQPTAMRCILLTTPPKVHVFHCLLYFFLRNGLVECTRWSCEGWYLLNLWMSVFT